MPLLQRSALSSQLPRSWTRNGATTSRLATWVVVGTTSLCLAAGLVLLRGRPSVDADAGIFLSVAARLLAGDRLYADVLDNKDPLFFYSFAGALSLGDWRIPFLLDSLWLALAASGTALLLRALGSSRPTATLGFVAYPLLLTGSYYYAGYSMLPALALAPLIGWLWLRGRFVWCGALLGVGLLYKLNLLLVLASGPAALAYARLPAVGPRRRVARVAVGLLGVLGVAALVLAALRELAPYARTIADNVSYADDVLAATGRPTGLYGHLWTLAGVTDHSIVLAVLFGGGGALAIWILANARLRPPRPRDAPEALSALLVVSCVTTAVTFAATAVWNHHAQMLAWPGLFLVTWSAGVLEQLISRRLLRLAGILAAAAVPLWALGAFSQAPGVEHGQSWASAGHSAAADALERARAEHLSSQRSVRYAVLGTNHEQGHAEFLHGDWKLVCPRFQQYPFSPRLGDVVRCIRQRRPTLLLVTDRFAPRRNPRTAWDRFVNQVAALLGTSYKRVQDGVWEVRGGGGSPGG